MFENFNEKYGDWAIPIILVVLIGGLLAIKVFNMYWVPVIGPMIVGPEGIIRTLVITNPDDYDAAKQFASDMRSKVPGVVAVIDDNVLQHIKEGYITSNKYDLVVLYGDKTALTYDARKEIASYVNSGGNLMIIGAAGLRDMTSDGTISPYTFSWSVDDMAGIVSFAPDCGEAVECNVDAIKVSPAEIGDKITFVPVLWDHPIIARMGVNAPVEMDVTPQFKGLTRVQDLANQRIAYLEWRDADNKPHSVPAIIAYQSGVSGKVVYLAYNPLELKQEALFRNTILWVAGKL